MPENMQDKIIRKLGLRRNSFRKSSDLKSRSEDMDWVLQARLSSYLLRFGQLSCNGHRPLRIALLQLGPSRQAGGRSISREEFAFWLQDPDFIRLLDEAGTLQSSKSQMCWALAALGPLGMSVWEDCQASIDVSGRVALFDVLDADGGGELSVEELRGARFSKQHTLIITLC